MSKTSFSKVATLALATAFFILPYAANASLTPTTTTSITNTAPTLGNVAESWIQAYAGSATTDSRAESSTTYPTNAGTAVTFTGTADDPNSDPYYLAICKTSVINPGTNAAPTCDTASTWGISAETADNVAATVSYTTQASDVESNAWFAFACDKIVGGPGLCSAAGQGTGASGSPFMVNHAPTFTAGTIVDSTDASIQPGETVKFVNSADADADVNATQDTVTLYVCSGEADMGGVTTAFDYNLNSCTGGTLLCTQTGVNPASANATCNNATLVSIPTAHAADFTVKFFVEDGHSFNAAVESKDFEVTDVAPVLGTYTTTDNAVLTAGGSDTVSYSVTITDNNGDGDVTNVAGYLFEDTTIDLVAGACSADENNCYITASCTLSGQTTGTGKTAQGSDITLSAACAPTVWWNATSGLNWEVSVNPTDSGVIGLVTNFAQSNGNIEVNAVQAINVIEGAIAYGTVALGGTSSGQTTTMENYGNQVLDVLIQGTDMTGTPSGTIAAGQQKWHNTSAAFDYATAGNVLVTSSSGATTKAAGCADRNMAVRNDHTVTTENENMYWKIQIPAAQVAGSYTGTNTFAATASSTCVDGE